MLIDHFNRANEVSPDSILPDPSDDEVARVVLMHSIGDTSHFTYPFEVPSELHEEIPDEAWPGFKMTLFSIQKMQFLADRLNFGITAAASTIVFALPLVAGVKLLEQYPSNTDLIIPTIILALMLGCCCQQFLVDKLVKGLATSRCWCRDETSNDSQRLSSHTEPFGYHARYMVFTSPSSPESFHYISFHRILGDSQQSPDSTSMDQELAPMDQALPSIV